MSREPLVSVVVPARNAAGSIERLLDALEAQTLPGDQHELIVVDDASVDGTASAVREHGWPQLVASPQPRGSGASRNAGVARARAELIAFTDADCVPAPDWLERGLARFEADPVLDLLAGQVTIELGRRPSAAALVDAATFLVQHGNVVHGFAVTASMWVRRTPFEELGGFNERLRWSHSDKELGMLLTARGGKLTYAEEVRVDHPPRSARRELARKAYRIGRGHSELRRHGRVPAGGALAANPRYWIPRAAVKNLDRLRARGVRVTPGMRLRMLAVEALFLSWPRVAGDVVGSMLTFAGQRGSRPQDDPA